MRSMVNSARETLKDELAMYVTNAVARQVRKIPRLETSSKAARETLETRIEQVQAGVDQKMIELGS